MTETAVIERRLRELLGLAHAPVAVTFTAAPPAGAERVEAPAVSGCTYWKMAGEGRAFHTVAEDHHGCPIGAHTHHAPLTPEKAKELEGLIGTMVGLQYLKIEEVPHIPRRAAPLEVATYAPLSDAPAPPDVVLVRANARQAMLLSEAAGMAGIGHAEGLLGRPTCAAIPEAIRAGRAVVSVGCIGNRVYTGLGDDELYFAVPGAALARLVLQLASIVRANRELESFHRSRVASSA